MEAGIQTGTAIQAPLAILGFLLGLAAWWQTGQVGWATGAVATIANWPFTFFAIRKTTGSQRSSRARDPGDD